MKKGCPNISSPEWKRLVEVFSENKAWSVFINNNYELPDMETINSLIDETGKEAAAQLESDFIASDIMYYDYTSSDVDINQLQSTVNPTTPTVVKNIVAKLNEEANRLLERKKTDLDTDEKEVKEFIKTGLVSEKTGRNISKSQWIEEKLDRIKSEAKEIDDVMLAISIGNAIPGDNTDYKELNEIYNFLYNDVSVFKTGLHEGNPMFNSFDKIQKYIDSIEQLKNRINMLMKLSPDTVSIKGDKLSKIASMIAVMEERFNLAYIHSRVKNKEEHFLYDDFTGYLKAAIDEDKIDSSIEDEIIMIMEGNEKEVNKVYAQKDIGVYFKDFLSKDEFSTKQSLLQKLARDADQAEAVAKDEYFTISSDYLDLYNELKAVYATLTGVSESDVSVNEAFAFMFQKDFETVKEESLYKFSSAESVDDIKAVDKIGYFNNFIQKFNKISDIFSRAKFENLQRSKNPYNFDKLVEQKHLLETVINIEESNQDPDKDRIEKLNADLAKVNSGIKIYIEKKFRDEAKTNEAIEVLPLGELSYVYRSMALSEYIFSFAKESNGVLADEIVAKYQQNKTDFDAQELRINARYSEYVAAFTSHKAKQTDDSLKALDESKENYLIEIAKGKEILKAIERNAGEVIKNNAKEFKESLAEMNNKSSLKFIMDYFKFDEGMISTIDDNAKTENISFREALDNQLNKSGTLKKLKSIFYDDSYQKSISDLKNSTNPDIKKLGELREKYYQKFDELNNIAKENKNVIVEDYTGAFAPQTEKNIIDEVSKQNGIFSKIATWFRMKKLDPTEGIENTASLSISYLHYVSDNEIFLLEDFTEAKSFIKDYEKYKEAYDSDNYYWESKDFVPTNIYEQEAWVDYMKTQGVFVKQDELGAILRKHKQDRPKVKKVLEKRKQMEEESENIKERLSTVVLPQHRDFKTSNKIPVSTFSNKKYGSTDLNHMFKTHLESLLKQKHFGKIVQDLINFKSHYESSKNPYDRNVKWIEDFANYQFYGLTDDAPPEMKKLLSGLQMYTTMIYLGLSPTRIFINFGEATTTNLIDAIGKGGYKNTQEGIKLLSKKDPKANYWLDKFNVLTFEKDELDLEDNFMGQMVTLFFKPQEYAERYSKGAEFLGRIANKQMEVKVKKTNVKTGEVVETIEKRSLFDLYYLVDKSGKEIGEDGRGTLKTSKEFTENDILYREELSSTDGSDLNKKIVETASAIKTDIESVHGRISKLSRRLYHASTVWKAALTFKGWVFDSLQRRFRMKWIDKYGKEQQGYYSNFLQTMLGQSAEAMREQGMSDPDTLLGALQMLPKTIKNITSKEYWNKLNDDEKNSIKKVTTELAVAGLLGLIGTLLASFAGDDDDDELLSKLAKYPSSLISSLAKELVWFLNPFDALKMITTTSVVIYPIQQLLTVLTNTVKGNFNEAAKGSVGLIPGNQILTAPFK